ncbi:hypothetical protein GOP47_0002822 [Adiantum capillus-veneris]|uniref:Uncharacterized protein n=1 Tax=Adiantum capillus-veneris TaxID=13818 RepID=A0A9D4ZPI6_ADICA|nr:hypothetical protein GOP47_0002822 [Adiantum capillus-veneris]
MSTAEVPEGFALASKYSSRQVHSRYGGEKRWAEEGVTDRAERGRGDDRMEGHGTGGCGRWFFTEAAGVKGVMSSTWRRLEPGCRI